MQVVNQWWIDPLRLELLPIYSAESPINRVMVICQYITQPGLPIGAKFHW